MIDAHGNFDVSTATDLCNRMMPYNLTWFEEPPATRKHRSPPPATPQHRHHLCIGERKYTRWDFLPYLTEGLVNYIMPDICWTGGISEMKKIAHLAETFYIPISPHDASGSFNVISGAHVLMNVPQHLPTRDEPPRRPFLQRLPDRSARHPRRPSPPIR